MNILRSIGFAGRFSSSCRFQPLLLAALILAPSLSLAQPTVVTPRAGWRVGGTVNTIVRVGNVLYLGGVFRGVASEANVAGNVLAVDAASGLPIPGFATINGSVFAMEPDGAGGWYVAGNFLDVISGGVLSNRLRLAHILPSGGLDPNWAPAAEGGAVRAMRVVPGVGVFVGGDFTSLNGVARSRVGLLDPVTGATLPWTYAVDGLQTTVRALAYHGGQLFIGGNFSIVNGQPRNFFVVTSATANGQMSADLGLDEEVAQIVTTGSDNIYIGGFFTTVLGQTRLRLARITHAAGSLAPVLDGWNPGANGSVRAIAHAAGSVYVGGDFSQIGGQPRGRLAQLDEASGAPSAFAPEPRGVPTSLMVNGETLYVGGSFDNIGGQTRNGLAAIATSSGVPTPWNPAPAGTVNVIAAAGATVAIGGELTGHGAVSRSNMAAVDLDTGQLLPWNPNANGGVNKMVLRDSTLYIAGSFTALGADERRSLAAVDLVLGEPLAWNPGTNGAVTAMLLDTTSAYVGGTFTTVGGQNRTRLARIDLATGAVDPTFTPSASLGVNDLELLGTTLYAGGLFTTINGVPTERVAALNAQTGALVPGFAASANAVVNALEIDGNLLYLAGNFTQVNATARTYAARVSVETGALDGWTPNVAMSAAATTAGFTPGLNDIDVQATAVMLSGAFDHVGAQTRFGVAAVDKATGAVHPWAPNLGAPPYGGFGGAIYAASDLTAIGGARIQLADDILAGLALFVEPGGLNPQPPATLNATVIGNAITLTWTTSPLARPAVSYLLEAGTARGLTNVATLDVGNTTTFSVGSVPPGVYYVRVRAVTSLGVSAPSPEIAVTVGGSGCTMPPQAPTDLAYQSDNGTVILRWSAPPGTAPSGFTIVVGSQPGASNLASLDVGPMTEITIPGVPAGAYYWRVVARNGCGSSAPSPDFIVAVGDPIVAPLAPLAVTGSATGGNVRLSWIAPPYIPVSSYRLEVGTGPRLSNIATVPVAGTTFSVTGAPAGRYYIRVRAINPGGVSLPSNEFVLTVP